MVCGGLSFLSIPSVGTYTARQEGLQGHMAGPIDMALNVLLAREWEPELLCSVVSIEHLISAPCGVRFWGTIENKTVQVSRMSEKWV